MGLQICQLYANTDGPQENNNVYLSPHNSESYSVVLILDTCGLPYDWWPRNGFPVGMYGLNNCVCSMGTPNTGYIKNNVGIEVVNCFCAHKMVILVFISRDAKQREKYIPN